MLSIQSYSNIINTKVSPREKTSNQSFSGSDISSLLEKGDNALNENRLSDALNLYLEAKNKNPEETLIYRKLGKTYLNMKIYNSAQENYEKYLQDNSNDSEAWIDYGDSLRKNGFYTQAIEAYEKALEIDKANDLAKRNIMEAKNDMLAVYSPKRAKEEKDNYASENLRKALQMAVNYLGTDYMSKLSDVKFQFGETASMGGTANIAQYENYKKGITVSNTHIYAAPQVIAAYLVHESVHASDKDAYTSVREEQDAYKLATKFWIKNANGVKDPEMDYAASLYKKSPSALSSRVEEIYTLRDPNISKTSPNHPPKQKKSKGLFTRSNAASQSLKQYNVIA